MYTIYHNTGEVFRDADNILVAPTSDPNNADYLGYISWIDAGNEPTIGSISPSRLITLQTQMADLIKTERYRRTSTGGYLVGGHWYNSDDSSRIQQMALVMMGAGMPAGIMWKTLSGEFVLMSPTLAGQIFQAAAASDMAMFAVSQTKISAMMALSDPSAYDYLTGWPRIYGE